MLKRKPRQLPLHSHHFRGFTTNIITQTMLLRTSALHQRGWPEIRCKRVFERIKPDSFVYGCSLKYRILLPRYTFCSLCFQWIVRKSPDCTLSVALSSEETSATGTRSFSLKRLQKKAALAAGVEPDASTASTHMRTVTFQWTGLAQAPMGSSKKLPILRIGTFWLHPKMSEIDNSILKSLITKFCHSKEISVTMGANRQLSIWLHLRNSTLNVA